MTKKILNKEMEKLYKQMNREKFIMMVENIHVLNSALSHLAYVCKTEKGLGSLQIPLHAHTDANFNFSVMEHKVTHQKVLVVEVVDVKENSTH